VSSGRLEKVKNNKKFKNIHPKKWSQLLTRGGRLQGSLTAGHWLVGRYRESINSQQVINFHVLIVSRISRRSVYFESDFR